ncbi:MAG TPA: tRNA (adenine-N1)-methyltransferase [Anaerolineaceae bacterium]|nr:tRNA (adenine-N1)-methyltransferase [Anaerolineaceae bacterium]HPT24529.1 tRNA (adenine-N1)-methyltransferase [Anaerolineaceae bacterium]
MTDDWVEGTAKEGDLVQLQGSGYKSHILRLQAGAVLQTHRGVIRHDDIIGQKWGTRLQSHQGNPFYLFQPGLADLIREIKRTTQIMYPKEISYVMMILGVGPGKRVLECGGGSGALTTAFATMVGEEGKVYSYERKPEIQALARSNLARVNLDGRVVFKLGDAADGFEERDVDALFLDLPNPYDYLVQAKASLKGGGYLGMLVPTVNQVERCLQALQHHQFAFVEVCEILLRYYKTDWDRLRPVDRMIAHTGYLLFGRSVDRLDALEEPEEVEGNGGEL